jgi:hypothetical protein
MPISFIRNIVKDKIIGGALIREKQQYQKLVGDRKLMALSQCFQSATFPSLL